jgi:glycosyltransferase involved in cell wall biosynthesis
LHTERKGDPVVVVAAHNEADRIGATLDALARAFPGAEVFVADDASTDGTSEVALAGGAQVVSRRRPHGKGANMSAAAEAALDRDDRAGATVYVLCDADLGSSAEALRPLAAAVQGDSCDLAVAQFRNRVGGGFGIALGFARWAIERRCGFRARAALSGQRAMRAAVLRDVLPFADGYGMETGMTIDAVRAGYQLREIELDLEHRATGRSLAGFLHRGQQLWDIARAYRSRR